MDNGTCSDFDRLGDCVNPDCWMHQSPGYCFACAHTDADHQLPDLGCHCPRQGLRNARVMAHEFAQEFSAESPYCGAMVLDAEGCGDTCGKPREHWTHRP